MSEILNKITAEISDNGILKPPGVVARSLKRKVDTGSQEESCQDYTPESHAGCLLCGRSNSLSLGLRFKPDGTGAVRTEVRLNGRLQGYEGMLHGGVISSLLDAAMTHNLFHAGIEAVTADLRVRFVHPVPCRGRVTLRSWILKSFPPLYSVRAELLIREQVMAWGEGKFSHRREKS